MKKIAALILVSVLLLAVNFSVSAKTTHDNHYDFYGKAGPTIENVLETPTVTNVTLNTAVAIAPSWVNNQTFKEINITTTVKEKKYQRVTMDAEAADLTYNLQRPERPVSDYWPDIDYPPATKIKEVTQPPSYRRSVNLPLLVPLE